MKQLKFIFASALVAAVLVFAACKKDSKDDPVNPSTEVSVDPNPSDEPNPSVDPGSRPAVEAPAADKVRVVVNYASACSDVVVLSSWNNNNDLAQAVKFTKIQDGWWQADLDAAALTAEAEGVANTLRNCKILFAGADGVVPGNWSSQWNAVVDENGDPAEDNAVVIEGKAHLVGDMGMAAMYIEEDAAGTIIWITITGLQDNPCKEKQNFEQITFNVEVTNTDILAAIAANGLYIHGSFTGPNWEGAAMTKVDDNNWTFTATSGEYQLKEGEEYKYTVGAGWDNEAYDENGKTDNRKAIDREMYDTIKKVKGINDAE